MQLRPFYKLFLLTLLTLLLTSCGAGQTATPIPEPTATVGPAPTKTPFPTPAPTLTPTATPAPIAGERSIGDPYSPELGNTGYDVLNYTLQLAIDPAVRNLEGIATIDAVAEIDGLELFTLDFVGFDVDRVLLDGTRARDAREGSKLLIFPKDPLAEGQEFTLEIEYSGQPQVNRSDYLGGEGFLGLLFTGSIVHAISEPDGSAYWFPCNDHPQDKALFRFEITVPLEETAVANGTLVEVIGNTPLPDGTPGHTFVWGHQHPMATYLATIAVGRFIRQDLLTEGGVLVRSYLPEDALVQEQFTQATANIGETVDWMSELLGPYPFEAFGFVVLDTFSSLETQTMVLYDIDQLREEVAVHELAHMWFGDHASLDSWGEMWRNEGFATYLQLLWEYREDPDGLDEFIDGLRQSVDEYDAANPFPVRNPPRAELFGFKSYLKGALFIHELRNELGDATFFAGLREYLASYGGGTASDEDFRAVMESVSNVRLEGFFNGWLDEVPEVFEDDGDD